MSEPDSVRFPFDPADISAGIEFLRVAAREQRFRDVGIGCGLVAMHGLSRSERETQELRSQIEHSLDTSDNEQREAAQLLLGVLDVVVDATISLPVERIRLDQSSLETLRKVLPGEAFREG